MAVHGDAPSVSIGMPVYNGSEYLPQAVDSILGQTFDDFELIISDNASTDATPTICQDYASADKRVSYLRSEKNRGASWNFNRVARAGRAPFFKWACHDDVVAPEFLDRCMSSLADVDEEFVLCYPRAVEIDAAGEVVREPDKALSMGLSEPEARVGALFREYWRSNPIFGVIRAQTIRSTNLLRPYPSSDVVLLAELALRGRFYEIEQPLLYRRIHSGASRKVNPDAVAAAAWFDPNDAGRPRAEWTRVFYETLRSIWRAPISLSQKEASTASLVRAMYPRWYRKLGRESLEYLRAVVFGKSMIR